MEANKVTEGLFKRRLFFYCHLFAVDGGVRQIPLGFLVVFAQAMHQFVGGGYLSRNRRISKGAVRVREQLGACVGKRRFRDKKDRKSTRLNSITNAHLVCRLLLEKKKKTNTNKKTTV